MPQANPPTCIYRRSRIKRITIVFANKKVDVCVGPDCGVLSVREAIFTIANFCYTRWVWVGVP